MKQLLIAILALLPFGVSGQMLEPVKWTSEWAVDGDEGVLTLTATIDDGWHLYATELPEMDYGPSPTAINFTTLSGAEVNGEIEAESRPIEKYDAQFEADLRFWEHTVVLHQYFTITDPEHYSVAGTVDFMACNDQNCTTGSQEFSFGDAQAAAAVTASGAAQQFDPAQDPLWEPVDGGGQDVADSSLWQIFLYGFLGGLVALLTPCVWPMIPMTVSFFLKKNATRAKAVREAIIYGLSIVVIYLVFGLLITIIFGASALNSLSTNAVFNLIFFALLVVFAISFFGAFDIKLPSKWSNAVDSKAESTTGILSIFFMAFTLVLVSFSCTGPIIGTLLVEAAGMGSYVGPAVGMFAFALALAIPFALFAIFPSVLKSAPRSGGWLNSVKVVLGFLELALSLKFLSVADMAYGWRLLDREVFVALWVVIFALLGMYLLGKLRFSHDTPAAHTGVLGFFLALISLSFSVYLLPGLWGAPLKAVSAFVPPLSTQDFNLYQEKEFTTFHDYDEGMAYAAEHNMPVFMDFSGYGCVNCRKMENAVFDTPQVGELLEQNFVMIELMVDDKTALPAPIVVEENGKQVTLRTVGDKWSYLQRYKFAANAQPYYMVLDNEGKPVSPSAGHDEDVDKFAKYLQTALDEYKNR
jgi:thiol:disulfide interchange protein DsbD